MEYGSFGIYCVVDYYILVSSSSLFFVVLCYYSSILISSHTFHALHIVSYSLAFIASGEHVQKEKHQMFSNAKIYHESPEYVHCTHMHVKYKSNKP